MQEWEAYNVFYPLSFANCLIFAIERVAGTGKDVTIVRVNLFSYHH